jgi:hypothetical protein
MILSKLQYSIHLKSPYLLYSIGLSALEDRASTLLAHSHLQLLAMNFKLVIDSWLQILLVPLQHSPVLDLNQLLPTHQQPILAPFHLS